VNNFEQLPRPKMSTTPAKPIESTNNNPLSSMPPLSDQTARAVLPSYFAVKIQISRESLLSDLPGGNAAELHFASQLLPPAPAQRVA
jgi:hypothetical protein